MQSYLRKKYSYLINEFSVCHVQYELLCSDKEAGVIVRNVCKQKALSKYFTMTFNQFCECVEVGLTQN